MKNTKIKGLKGIIAILLIISVISMLACTAFASEELPMPAENEMGNTLFFVLLVVLVCVFMLALVFLAAVIMKTGKKK